MRKTNKIMHNCINTRKTYVFFIICEIYSTVLTKQKTHTIIIEYKCVPARGANALRVCAGEKGKEVYGMNGGGRGVKISKRLVRAIIAFAVSLVLCIGVCFAWLSNVSRAGGDGLKNTLKGVNIATLEVKVYALTAIGTENVYAKGAELTGGKMKDYGNLLSTEPTVALLEITYSFEQALDKKYDIHALGSADKRTLTKSPQGDSFQGNLSDAVEFFSASANGNNFTLARDKGFYGADDEKITDVLLTRTAITCKDKTAKTRYSFYCAVDYVETQITQLYSKALANGGTLSSQLIFGADIAFYMTESFRTDTDTV